MNEQIWLSAMQVCVLDRGLWEFAVTADRLGNDSRCPSARQASHRRSQSDPARQSPRGAGSSLGRAGTFEIFNRVVSRVHYPFRGHVQTAFQGSCPHYRNIR